MEMPGRSSHECCLPLISLQSLCTQPELQAQHMEPKLVWMSLSSEMLGGGVVQVYSHMSGMKGLSNGFWKHCMLGSPSLLPALEVKILLFSPHSSFDLVFNWFAYLIEYFCQINDLTCIQLLCLFHQATI